MIEILKQKIERFSHRMRDTTGREECKPSDGVYLCCVMSREICEFARRIHSVPRRKYRLTIMDDGGEAAAVTLLKSGHDINRMTLVTDREEHFESVIDELYEEEGLVVEIADRDRETEGMTVEFNGTFCVRMDDNTRYDKIFFSLDGKEWEAGELQELLFGESSDELFLFGEGELPDGYAGRIFVEKLANS